MFERNAKQRAEIIARDIATAKANRRASRVENDGSHIVFGSANVDAVVAPDDLSALPAHECPYG
jgi:hypothetical protein